MIALKKEWEEDWGYYKECLYLAQKSVPLTRPEKDFIKKVAGFLSLPFEEYLKSGCNDCYFDLLIECIGFFRQMAAKAARKTKDEDVRDVLLNAFDVKRPLITFQDKRVFHKGGDAFIIHPDIVTDDYLQQLGRRGIHPEVDEIK